MQHRRPEQGMKINNVLTDEVIHISFAVLADKVIKIDAFTFAQVLEAGEITDRRIQPHIKILVFCARDLKTEIGFVTRDVPFLQPGLEPFIQLVGHFALQMTGFGPVTQHGFEITQFEKIMF